MRLSLFSKQLPKFKIIDFFSNNNGDGSMVPCAPRLSSESLMESRRPSKRLANAGGST
jgi:hypothetical protein